jgi:hypothetical protein
MKQILLWVQITDVILEVLSFLETFIVSQFCCRIEIDHSEK